MEFVPIREGCVSGFDTSLRVIGIDMNDRDLESLRKITGVKTASRFVFYCGEAQLVVGDDVQTAARRIAWQARKVEGLRNNSLSRKRGVTMNQDGKRSVIEILW